jgi:hypothetical protein
VSVRIFTILIWAAVALAGCGGGAADQVLYARSLQWQTSQGAATLSLAPGEGASLSVSICPAIVVTNVPASPADPAGAEGLVAYQPGIYTLSVEQLPPGVQAVFTAGAAREIPQPTSGGQGFGPDGLPMPDPRVFSEVRYCFEVPLRLQRDATPGAGPPTEVLVRLDAPLASGQTRVLTVRRVDSGAGTPPVTGGACSAGNLLAGRWADAAAPVPPLTAASTSELDAVLVQDRPLVGRLAGMGVGGGGQATLDEWSGSQWLRRTGPAQAASLDALRLAVARDAGSGAAQRWVAWRATDFTQPRARQTVVQVHAVSEAGAWQPASDFAADAETEVRQLQLTVWQGRPLVAWARSDGLSTYHLQPDGRFWRRVEAPLAFPADGSTRELRLTVDPIDDTLWLVAGRLEADGVTRLRSWRLAGPGADWAEQPVLEAGPPGGLLAGLYSLAAVAQAGELTLAWAYGSASFGATPPAEKPLRVVRLAAGASAFTPLGDSAALTDLSTGYARQPLGLTLAASCTGGVFMAWSETGNAPDGHVRGAQYAALDGWDRFGGSDLATLPGGSYGGRALLLAASDGRPILVAGLPPLAGGSPFVAVRRFGP